MKELKFRAWDGTQMLTEENFNFVVSAYDSIIKLDEYGWTEHGVDCVEQFTGLLDRNGKEIYEGDIVKCYSRRKLLGDYQVIWNEDCSGFECESLKPLVDGGGKMLKDVRVFCEIAVQFRVIGNIHENADLLGVKEEE